MKVVTCPSDRMVDEDSILSVLDKEVLQACNDSQELIHLKVFKVNDVGKRVLDERANEVVVKNDFSYLKLKNHLKTQKFLSFVVVDNILNERIFVLGNSKLVNLVYSTECVDGNVVYYGENSKNFKSEPLAIKSKWTVSVFCSIDSKSYDVLFPFNSKKEAVEFDEFIRSDAIAINNLFISGMYIPMVTAKSLKRSAIVVSEYKVVKDSFSDVAKIIPKINSYKDISIWCDLKTGVPFYSREVNELLMFNVCYLKRGRSVFNLVLSGVPGSGKTSLIGEFSKIFSDGQVLQAGGSTLKGLVPSFANEVSSAGYLGEPGFLKTVDELFRFSSSVALERGVNMVNHLLSKLLPLLTRLPQIYASARSSNFTVEMTSAFLATDNLTEVVRTALARQLEEDPAILRRFSLIYLTEEDWEIIRYSDVSPSSNEIHSMLSAVWFREHGFKVNLFKRFARWFRLAVNDVKVDSKKCSLIIDEEFFTLLKKTLNTPDSLDVELKKLIRKVDYMDHFKALVECFALFRVIYTTKTETLPSAKDVCCMDEDYEEARRVFKRIVKDSVFLFRANISNIIYGVGERDGSGGVSRF